MSLITDIPPYKVWYYYEPNGARVMTTQRPTLNQRMLSALYVRILKKDFHTPYVYESERLYGEATDSEFWPIPKM